MTATRPHAVGLRTALVTGASSGIGAAYARRLAAEGCQVTLVARREPELTTLAAQLRQRFKVQAHVVAADLATPEGVDQATNRLANAPVDWLINNAGFGVPGLFDQVPLHRSLAMIQLHLLASTRLSHVVLPGMIGRGHGRIVNVASIGAFLPRPGDATYCATKAYLVTFSRALHGELAGTGVQVQALCPGFTRTNFYQGSEYTGYHVNAAVPHALWMSPDAVVSASLKGFDQDRPVCIPGIQNRILITMARLGLGSLLVRRLGNRLPPLR